MDSITNPKGNAFLLSLDPELNPDSEAIRQAVIYQSLFAEQICLTDAHLFTSLSFKNFIANNSLELKQEDLLAIYKAGGKPLFASCGRKGIDLDKGLLTMLEQNRGLPTYISSVPYDKNLKLIEYAEKEKSIPNRRDKLFNLDPTYQSYFNIMSDYFLKNGDHSVISNESADWKQQPQNSFYNEVKNTIAYMHDQRYKKIFKSLLDERIIDNIQKAISNNKDSAETRELLHEAIFEGRIPRYYKGKWYEGGKEMKLRAKERNWREFVNILYNMNLYFRLPIQAIRNTNWFSVKLNLAHMYDLHNKKVEIISKVPLRYSLNSPIIRLEHVLKIRQEKIFWESLPSLLSAQTSEDYETRFKMHWEYISSRLGQMLGEKIERKNNLVLKIVGHAITVAVPSILYYIDAISFENMICMLGGGLTAEVSDAVVSSSRKSKFGSFLAELKGFGVSVTK